MIEPRNGFCQFSSISYGIRALCRTLFSYHVKYGLNSVSEIISRYAPPSENDTAAYIDFVTSRMVMRGYEPGVSDVFYNASTFLTLVESICQMETSYHLTVDDDANILRHYVTLLQ